MPIYEYVCEKCKNAIEVMQSFKDEPLKECEKCQGKLHKVISETSFVLKGTGWYKTDYAKTEKPKENEKNKTPEKKSPECSKCPAAASCE